MFPSTYCSLGPCPCFPNSSSSSSSYSYPYPAFPFLNNNPHENNASAPPGNNTTTTTLLLHDPLSVPYNAPNIPETLANYWAVNNADHYAAAMLKQQDLSGASGGSQYHYGVFSRNPPKKKPAAKKDRHSKIHTSQGFRDRRVRLSIEIARKFFDLQDMLGFDKASNTLEWLFNKSKKAIEDLTQSKKQHMSMSDDDDHNNSFSSNNFSSAGEEVDDDGDSNKLERKLKKELMKKESREKARARARERTSGKEKCPETDHQNNNPNQIYFNQLRSNDDEGQRDHHDEFNVIEESIVIKRKLKQSSHRSQNTASFDNNNNNISTDEHCHSSFPMSPNWDANNNGNGRSTFCTISSMNLSAGLQIFGKSWEECNTGPHLY